MSELASLIIAIAALISSIGTFIVSLRNSKKIEAVRSISEQVQIETNGMKAELVNEVRAASFAKGVKSETDKSSGDHVG